MAAARLPDITVQQLEYLVAVARSPTWAVAAASVGVTQSALSQGLAELERRVGLPLFERQGRRRVLAPSAQPVLDHAESVLARTRDLVSWAGRRRSGRTGTLHLGMIDAAALHHFPAALRAFRAARPELEVRLIVAPSSSLLTALARGDVDVAVCVEPPAALPEIRHEVLRDEPLAVYAPQTPSPSVALDPRRWGPWVSFPEGAHTRQVVARALAERGARFEVVAESHQPEVLREMVRLGLGWAVLPVSQAESGPEPLDRAVPEPVAARRIVLARRRSAVDDGAVDALRHALLAGATGAV